MTTSAKMAHGTLLKRAGTAIAEITKLGDFEISTESIDVTNTDSAGWVEVIPGLKSGKDLEIEGNFRPDDANGQMQLKADFVAGTVAAFTIEGPSTLPISWGFNAFVKSFAIVTPVAESKPAGFKATLAITGEPLLTYQASGDLTALAITTATLTPALTASEYDYAAVTSGSSVTVTATKASATIKLYVDGVFSQVLTSGSASSAINTPATATQVLTISTQDAGKVPKWYRIALSKA